jgi:hypothetical protein
MPAAYALGGVAVLSPQLIGGATPTGRLTIMLLAVSVSVWIVLATPGDRRAAPWALLGAGLAALWTLIQILPLPCDWLAPLQSERFEVMRELVQLRALNNFTCTLSLAPGATMIALTQATVLSALLGSAALLGGRAPRRVVVHAVALGSIAMAIVALGHFIYDAKLVFGSYQPRSAVRSGLLIAPLLNANHLAGHFALGLPVCLSSAIQSKRMDVRILWIVGAVLVFACGLMTLSRGGVAALLLSGGGFLMFYAIRSKDRVTKPALRIGAVSALVLTALAASFSIDLIAREFRLEEGSFSKLRVMGSLIPLISTHPLAGLGRGALGDISPGVVPGNVRVPYAENLPLHWALEWGLPVTLLVLASFLASAISLRLKRSQDWALAFGLLALAAQNLVDFSLELMGLGAVAAIACGLLLSKEASAPSTSWARPRLQTTARFAAAASVVAVLATLPVLRSQSREQLQDALRSQVSTRNSSFYDTLSLALTRYPMDVTFAVLGALQAVNLNAANASHWLNLAMRRAPAWAAPHVIAAALLERRGHVDQAAIEISLVLEREPTLAWDPSCQLLARYPYGSIARSLVPGHSERSPWIAEHLAGCLIAARSPEAEDFVLDLLGQHTDSAYLHSQAVELALRRKAFDIATDRAWTMLRVLPANPSSTATLIYAMVGSGRPDEAMLVLRAAKPDVRAARAVLVVGIAAAARARQADQLDAMAQDLIASSTTVNERAEAEWRVSTQYETMGSVQKALAHAQLAYDASGDPALLERVHTLATRAGISRVVLRAAAELCHVRHQGDTYCVGSRGQQ